MNYSCSDFIWCAWRTLQRLHCHIFWLYVRASENTLGFKTFLGVTKCAACKQFGTSLSVGVGQEKLTSWTYLKKKVGTYLMAALKRNYSNLKEEKAVKNPENICIFIINEVDQSEFGLSKLTFATKGFKLNAMNIHLIGILEQCSVNRCSFLFTMTKEIQIGANHIFKAPHQITGPRHVCQGLPKPIHLQMDSCTGENKIDFWSAILRIWLNGKCFILFQFCFYPLVTHMRLMARIFLWSIKGWNLTIVFHYLSYMTSL